MVLPSPAELARQEAIRKAPKEPPYVKKPTWRETLITSREAMLAWESMQDELALPNSGATFGPWHVLGPLPRTSQEVAQLDREKDIDLTKTYPGKDGKPIA